MIKIKCNRIRGIPIVLLFFILAAQAPSQVRLPRLVSKGMVLQRIDIENQY